MQKHERVPSLRGAWWLARSTNIAPVKAEIKPDASRLWIDLALPSGGNAAAAVCRVAESMAQRGWR
jgi:hypothetical protein